MPIEIDYNAQLLKITSPDTEVDLQTLHDFVEDERGLAHPTGLAQIAPPSTSPTGDPIFVVEGKIEDPASPGNYSQILLVLVSPWQIQFWQGSGYTRVYGGKLSGGLNDQPVKATGAAGDLTVLQSQLDGTYTLVEGASASTLDSIDSSLSSIASDVTSIEGSVVTIETDIGAIKVDLGEVHDVYGLDAVNPVTHRKTPARIEVAGITLELTEDASGNVTVQRL